MTGVSTLEVARDVRTLQVVDADVHPHVRGGLAALAEFMPKDARVRAVSDASAHEKALGEASPDTAVHDLLDAHTLAAAVLLPLEPLNGFADPLTASIYVSALNRYFIETWLPVEERFNYALVINPLDVDDALAEIRRHAATPQVVAVLLPLLNYLLGDSRYHPIYRAVQEHGLSIIVHPTGAEGIYYGAPVLAGGPPASGVERHADLPHVAQSNVNSLVMQGVFERFRGLQVVFAGFGCGWVFPLLWRMDMDWRRLRREVPWTRRLPSEYVSAHVRFTLQPDDLPAHEPHLRAALELMDAARTLLYSSDYPHWYGVDPRAQLLQLPPPFRHRVAGANAIDTFGDRLRLKRAGDGTG